MKKKIKYNLNKEIRLDKYLTTQFSDLSRTKIQKKIQLGVVLVDGYIVKSSYQLKKSQIITIDNIFSKDECNKLIDVAEKAGFKTSPKCIS